MRAAAPQTAAVADAQPCPPEERDAAYRALRDALLARHGPADALERHWVEELAWAAARLRRLRALEDRALADAAAPTRGTNEPGGGPSLAVLARLRARVERDHRLALAELERLRAGRPRPSAALAGASAARLRWLAERAEAAETVAGTSGAAPRTNEPEPAPAAAAAASAAAVAAAAAMQRPRCAVTPV